MNDFWGALSEFLSSILVKAVIALAICCIYAIIRMILFGRDSDMHMIESILLFVGSIVIAHVVVGKISGK